MSRENAKDLALSLLIVAAVALLADAILLHCQLNRLSARADSFASLIASTEKRLETHLNPPKEPSFTDKAKSAYDRVKQVVKEEFSDGQKPK